MEATAAVSGTVTDRLTSKPVAGAMVQLGQPGTRAQYQITDDLGRFVFANLPAGRYHITASRAGFADSYYGRDVGGPGVEIALRAGDWFEAAHIQVSPVGVITGRIADEAGDPLVGAYVRVLMRATVAGSQHFVAGHVSRADDRGVYRIPSLRPGRYFVVVPSVQQSAPAQGVLSLPPTRPVTPMSEIADRKAAAAVVVQDRTALLMGAYAAPPAPIDGRRRAYPPTFFPGVTSLEAAQEVEVTAGQTSVADLRVQAAPAVRVSGRLVGDVASFAGYVMRLMPVGLEEMGVGSEIATAAVGDDGTFTMLNVPAGSYTLLAPGTSFEFILGPASIRSRSLTLPPTPGLGWKGTGSSGGAIPGAPGVGRTAVAPDSIADPHAGHARLSVTVGESDIEDLIVPVNPAGSIRGRIVYEDLPAEANVRLELAAADGSPSLGVRSIAADPSAANAFTARLLMPGVYAVRITGISDATLKTVFVNGEDHSHGNIPVAGGRVTDVTITVTGRGGRLEGTVRDPSGSPVPNASVVVFPTNPALWRDFGFTPTWIRTFGGASDGSYTTGHLRAGEYYVAGLRAEDYDVWTNADVLERIADRSVRVTIQWGDRRSLDVPVVTAR